MTLAAGNKLGPYEIVAPIGAGGMGEVYRARDPRVGRDVAIKVSGEQFSERFEREIHAVAALNHSNICTLYDVGPNYLVMELVEGPTLADRIKQGPIPLEESLEIARQIADALEAAHEKGIVHRDLKPANVKVRPDDTVKVLDFGLAKVGGTPAISSDNSPTLSVAQTAAGVILGTASYMSPEQAKGKTVDKRADIWAFGVVLYEMLTARQLFAGETTSDILASVLTREPEWEKVPVKVRRLLQRCLEKDPKKRMRDIGDAMTLLEGVPESAPAKRPWLAWSVAIVGVLTALTLGILYFRLASVEAPQMRLEVNTPTTSDPTSLAISPDGRLLVFVALSEGQERLWLRPLDRVSAQPLPETEGAANPFWSPDSRSIGFFADDKLKRIDIAGGPPHVVAGASMNLGGAWNPDGVIVVGSKEGPLYRVPTSGSDEVAITKLDPPRQTSHLHPQFLPDGRHLLYLAWGTDQGGGVYFASLDSVETRRLVAADTVAVYALPGYLLFMRQGTLFAQRFDPVRGMLSGDPVAVADSVAVDSTTANPGFSVSGTGVLAYRAAGANRRQLVWFNRSGKEVGTLGAPDENDLLDPTLSSAGSSVAVDRNVQGNQDIWLIETARGIPSRFTFDAANDAYPIWSPDGSRIAFGSTRKGSWDIYQKASSGVGNDELLFGSSRDKSPLDWSPDGRFLLYVQPDPSTGYDLWVLPLFGERKPFPFVATSFTDGMGRFSPDGRWVAYSSNMSGRFEVYVQAFPGPGGMRQVSTGGGITPVWRHDGKELFFIAPDSKLMAAPINGAEQTLEIGVTGALFQTRIKGGGFLTGPPQYAVSPDGQRFLINTIADESIASPIIIVTNWARALKK